MCALSLLAANLLFIALKDQSILEIQLKYISPRSPNVSQLLYLSDAVTMKAELGDIICTRFAPPGVDKEIFRSFVRFVVTILVDRCGNLREVIS